MITEAQLKAIMPYATRDNIARFIQPLNDTMAKYEINTPLRVAAFLAQLAHESGCLKYVREIASGEAYEGRKDLGNVQKGDGVRFKGRGLIQITGRANYTAVAKELGVDCVNNPVLLENATYAALTAGWFWNRAGLNASADKGDFERITRKINGGLNGFEDRKKYYEIALKQLKYDKEKESTVVA